MSDNDSSNSDKLRELEDGYSKKIKEITERY